jgi:hypothetical protein
MTFHRWGRKPDLRQLAAAQHRPADDLYCRMQWQRGGVHDDDGRYRHHLGLNRLSGRPSG